MPIGDRQASCASWQQALDLSIWCHVFRMLNLFSFHLTSSHRSFSSKLLTASHCHHSLCYPISSQLISCLLSFFTSSQLFAANVILSQLIWCHFFFFEINLLSCGISWLFISRQNIWSLISFSCTSYTCHSISFPNPTGHRSSCFHADDTKSSE